jgi:hypothetical protein
MGVAIARFYYDYQDNTNGYKKLVSTIFTGIASRALLLIGVSLAISPFIGKIFIQEPLQDFFSYGPFLIIVSIDVHTNVFPKMMFGSPITKIEPI